MGGGGKLHPQCRTALRRCYLFLCCFSVRSLHATQRLAKVTLRNRHNKNAAEEKGTRHQGKTGPKKNQVFFLFFFFFLSGNENEPTGKQLRFKERNSETPDGV